MKHIFIINPVAGIKNHVVEISDYIKEHFTDLEYIIYETKYHGDATRYVKEFLANHVDINCRFYACGGDGTFNEVVNGTIGYKNVEVASYPIGSGNDLLKSFGNISDFKDLKNLVYGEKVVIDLLKFNDKYIANIFNIGFDAKVVYKQAKLKRLPFISGKGAYNLGVVSCAFGKMSYKFKLTVDDKVLYEGDGTLCAVANGVCYGGGYYCAPIAKINDGILDICFIKKVSLLKFAKLVKPYKKGEHLDNEIAKPYVLYAQGKKVQIEIEKPLFYSNDGEVDKTDNITIEVVPSCLNFIIPAKKN